MWASSPKGWRAFVRTGSPRTWRRAAKRCRCLATPVFFGSPVPIAAISVSAPKDRLPTGMMPEVAALFVRETGDLRDD